MPKLEPKEPMDGDRYYNTVKDKIYFRIKGKWVNIEDV